MPETIEAPVDADARFCESVITGNERFNKLGISDTDVAICFEMSDLCDWGGSYTSARFKRALGAMTGVVKVGDRWYPAHSRNIDKAREVLDEKRGRVCARGGCNVALTRANSKYCSPRCRDRDYRSTRQPEKRRKHPRSETRGSANFGVPGPNPLGGSISVVHGPSSASLAVG